MWSLVLLLHTILSYSIDPCGVASHIWKGGIDNYIHQFTFNHGYVCIQWSMVGHTVVTCHLVFSSTMSTWKICFFRIVISTANIWVFLLLESTLWRGCICCCCFIFGWIYVVAAMELSRVVVVNWSHYVFATMCWWFGLLLLLWHGLCCRWVREFIVVVGMRCIPLL